MIFKYHRRSFSIKQIFLASLKILQIIGANRIVESVPISTNVNKGEDAINLFLTNLLKYWREKLLTSNTEFSDILDFLVVKSVQLLALHYGYLNEGGALPPPFKEPPFNPLEVIGSIGFREANTSLSPKVAVICPFAVRTADAKEEYSSTFSECVKCLTTIRYLKKIVIVGSNIDSALYLPTSIKEKVDVIELKRDKGPAHARNIGIEIALSSNCNIIMFMDHDIVITEREGIEKLAKKAYSYQSIMAPLIKSYGASWFDAFHDFEGTLNGRYISIKTKWPLLLYATTCCLAVPASIFECGLRFDETFKLAAGEDIDLSLRAVMQGVPIIAINGIVIKHNYGYIGQQDDIHLFINRYERYGRGNATLLNKYPYYYKLLSASTERQTVHVFRPIHPIPQAIREIYKNILMGR